jgi:hypothetical protein
MVFNDPLYYNLKESKLLGDGLTLGCNTYINTRSGSVAKKRKQICASSIKGLHGKGRNPRGKFYGKLSENVV